MEFDDEFDDGLDSGSVDVCPTCGTLLDGIEEPGVDCSDPMGCGAYVEDYSDEGYADDEDDDYGLEELDFDN
jgi:hypothetical protein